MGNRSLEGGRPKNKTGCPKGKVVRKLVSNIAGDRALEIQRNIEKSYFSSFSYFPNREKTAVNQPSPKNIFFLQKYLKLGGNKYIILKLRK